MSTTTEMVRASEIYERVVMPVFDMRYPGKRAERRAELAQYKKRLRGSTEVVRWVPVEEDQDLLVMTRKARGFVSRHMGQEVFIERPKELSPMVWQWWSSNPGYRRACEVGLLADSRFNRPIREDRVDSYVAEMEAGLWRDLLSDPLSITTDGQVVNGQHRIAAVSKVDWSKVENDPQFLVVWGVDPAEAVHADGSRRTDRDSAIVSGKVASALSPG